MTKPLTYAMIGGGTGSFIGAVHRKAIALDGQAALVAGAFASTPERSLASARELGVDPSRSYGFYEELCTREAARPDPVDFVVIVTPNPHPLCHRQGLPAGGSPCGVRQAVHADELGGRGTP
jgi:predicted dehydrogenase